MKHQIRNVFKFKRWFNIYPILTEKCYYLVWNTKKNLYKYPCRKSSIMHIKYNRKIQYVTTTAQKKNVNIFNKDIVLSFKIIYK